MKLELNKFSDYNVKSIKSNGERQRHIQELRKGNIVTIVEENSNYQHEKFTERKIHSETKGIHFSNSIIATTKAI